MAAYHMLNAFINAFCGISRHKKPRKATQRHKWPLCASD